MCIAWHTDGMDRCPDWIHHNSTGRPLRAGQFSSCASVLANVDVRCLRCGYLEGILGYTEIERGLSRARCVTSLPLTVTTRLHRTFQLSAVVVFLSVACELWRNRLSMLLLRAMLSPHELMRAFPSFVTIIEYLFVMYTATSA